MEPEDQMRETEGQMQEPQGQIQELQEPEIETLNGIEKQGGH